jgi:hypothetical protein
LVRIATAACWETRGGILLSRFVNKNGPIRSRNLVFALFVNKKGLFCSRDGSGGAADWPARTGKGKKWKDASYQEVVRERLASFAENHYLYSKKTF